MTVRKKSLKISKMVKLQTFVSTYHPSSSVFMTNNMPSGAKKHSKGTEPESHQKAKCFSFQRQNVSFQKAKIFTSSSSSSFLFFVFHMHAHKMVTCQSIDTRQSSVTDEMGCLLTT